VLEKDIAQSHDTGKKSGILCHFSKVWMLVRGKTLLEQIITKSWWSIHSVTVIVLHAAIVDRICRGTRTGTAWSAITVTGIANAE